MVRELLAPPGPVVGDVVPPYVEVVGDALLAEQVGHPPRARQRPGRVRLPCALPHGQYDVQPRPHPVEVVAVEVGHVVGRVGEVRRVPALAPAVPRRRVVVAGLADRDREQVGALQGDLERVVGAHRAPGDDRVGRTVAVGADVRRDLVGDPGLVRLMAPRPLLDRQRPVGPRGMVEGVDAVELDPTVVDQLGDGADHPVVLVVPRAAGLAGEHDHRSAVVAVPDDGAGPVEAGCVELDLVAFHHAQTRRSRSVR